MSPTWQRKSRCYKFDTFSSLINPSPIVGEGRGEGNHRLNAECYFLFNSVSFLMLLSPVLSISAGK